MAAVWLVRCWRAKAITMAESGLWIFGLTEDFYLADEVGHGGDRENRRSLDNALVALLDPFSDPTMLAF